MIKTLNIKERILMQVVTLEIKDDFLEKFLHVIEALPNGKVRLKKDVLYDELAQRIEAIDNGAEELTPYMHGMEEMLTRVKAKHANS